MELREFLVEAKVNTYASNGEGNERIFYKGKEIYRLSYHGGIIRKKL